MKSRFLSLIFIIATLSLSQNIVGQALPQIDEKMVWWKDAKFGMFIHWGLYSVPAGKWSDNTTYGEWLMYEAKVSIKDYSALANQFNPVKFNAEDWVLLAKAAGQKYIVITAKHHDGFAMYDSKVSDYNIVKATPFKRDVLKELAEACRKYNMKLGFYYSQAQDWYHPGGAINNGLEWDKNHQGDMGSYIDKIAVPQVKEIFDNYGDVAVLWWDTPQNMTKEMSQKLADILKKYPNIISNNRLGAGMGGDLETPEQVVPATGFPNRNWETCMTMNNHWGYNAWDDNWKSTKDLLQKLIDVNSKGGNFLLNVGPNQYGEIPEVCQQTLHEIGDWLKLNGESIYGTNASPFPSLSWGKATRKNQTLYLHIFNWPSNHQLKVPMNNKITKAYLLVDKKNLLKINRSEKRSIIELPNYPPDKVASVLAIEFEGEPVVLPLPLEGKQIKVSSTKSGTNSENINDGDPKTLWQAAEKDSISWVEVDLNKPISINGFSVVEPWKKWNNRSQKLTLQYKQNEIWKDIATQSSSGTGQTVYFNPIKAQVFRLMINEPKGEPSLNEWLLFREE